ncbi:HAD-IIA family hydrolase [Pseudogracilibacillus auburnensis]|uniref:HAD-IIA family hydrolase n=1 Tax=Pseudogracilibacillus auburnensis TaxID=1494959 RepID=UPI001A958425|nr:HAD-IIA family hydrolase [Pseudogracilibacillus auburnensis]MBO1004205.1 HAD-IIA family hydrolase [Pseudogracilibacillus auburnensis]
MQKGFIFDLDGTIYLDNYIIEGAAETLKTLRNRGDKIVFLTNKSIETISSYVEKLNRLGIQANHNEVINSNYLAGLYLKKNLQTGEKVMVVGEDPLINKMKEMGIELTNKSDDANYVLLGWDRNFNYDKINEAFQAWSIGAKMVATNPDRTCPVEDGQIPDCGAMIGALEGATGEVITRILGKPSKLAADYIVKEVLELPPAQCYIVGDRLETDIKMGKDYGINSVLVLTGITTIEMAEQSTILPDYIINSVNDVINL